MNGQVVGDGARTNSYTSLAPLGASTFVANPATGSALASFLLVDSSVGDDGATVVTKTPLPSAFTPQDNHNYTVSATFKVSNVTVQAEIDHGSVTPTKVGNVFYGYKLTSPLVFTFSPATGYGISGISNVPAGAAKNIPGGVNKKATVTFPVGYVFDSSNGITTTGFDMVASTTRLSAAIQQIGAKTVVPDGAVSLTASVVGPALSNPSYTWQYVSGPANVAKNLSGGKLNINGNGTLDVTPAPALTLAGATTPTLSFTAPATVGQYKFLLTVADSTLAKPLVSLATVNVVASISELSNQCQTCHTANNVRRVADTSSHATCQACHFSGAGHPGAVNAAAVNSATFVVNADGVANGNGTAAAKDSNFCASCHGVTGNAAQAIPTVTTHQNKACADCHSSAHEPHVASAACQGCHATINDHTAANMGTKVCLDCHDGHNPTVGTKPFQVAAATHPPVTLYTFEEIGMQMNGGQKVPVQVDASGKGMPYSPKQTCGTSGCHVINGVDYSYDKISDHAFHSNQGRSEYTDTANGKFDATKNKPWTQTTAMVGKW